MSVTASDDSSALRQTSSTRTGKKRWSRLLLLLVAGILVAQLATSQIAGLRAEIALLAEKVGDEGQAPKVRPRPKSPPRRFAATGLIGELRDLQSRMDALEQRVEESEVALQRLEARVEDVEERR